MKKFLLDTSLILLLVALPILFHWRILTPNALDRGSFPQGDFAEQFYAFAQFAYDELSQGRLPLWNPYTYAGHPFIADVQSAVFYPPSLLVMLVARLLGGFSLYALEWQAVLHFSLAGVFTFLFARREFRDWQLETAKQPPCGVGDWSAFLSAIVFTFGGYLTAYPSQQLAILETDVWLPLSLLMLSKASADERRTTNDEQAALVLRPPSFVAGFFFGIALLAGHPQSALYVFMVSAAYAIVRGRQSAMRWRAIGLTLGVMIAVALGVSAVQWIPSLELMQLSSRQSLTYADYARGFELQDPLQLLLPGSVSFYSPLYVGIAPLALAICALWLPRRAPRMIWFWLALALFALMLSFGGNLFFYPLLYLFVPGFALFRQQERAAFIFAFALAMLAGYGARHVARVLRYDEHRRLRQIFRFSLGALCGALLFFVLLYFAWMAVQLQRDSPFRDVTSRAAWLMLMLALLCGLLWARLHGRLRRTALLAAIVAASALDLFTVNWHTNFQPAPPEAQTQMPAWLAPIKADTSLFRTFNEYRIFGNFGDLYQLEDTWGASPLRLARYEQFTQLPMERLWALLNVKYVITWRKALNVPSEVAAQEKVSDKETTYVHRLQTVTPRAALVTCVQVMRSDDEMLARLGTADFNFAQCALLDRPLSSTLKPAQAGSAMLAARLPDYMLWSVSAPTDALFVVSENFYPGWRAFVDNRETPILRANAIMMAVAVPAGEHNITLWFDPFSVKLGAGTSLITLVGLLVGWLVVRFKPRTTPP